MKNLYQVIASDKHHYVIAESISDAENKFYQNLKDNIPNGKVDHSVEITSITILSKGFNPSDSRFNSLGYLLV